MSPHILQDHLNVINTPMSREELEELRKAIMMYKLLSNNSSEKERQANLRKYIKRGWAFERPPK